MWLLVKNSIYLRVMSVLWEQAHIIHLSMLRVFSVVYRIAGNFRGRKLSGILRFCGVCESFLHKICEHGVFWRGKSEQSVKVFSTKIVFSPICESFFPLKVSRYEIRLVLLSCAHDTNVCIHD